MVPVRGSVKRDYYEILGINKNADGVAIKKAYRSLAMKNHPDRNTGDTEAIERMKEINEAYAVLSDTRKRQLYDTYGHAGLQGYTQEDIFRGTEFSSLFRDFGFGDIFGDSLFDNFFSGRTSRRRAPRKGADLRFNLQITLEEVASGTEKIIEIPREEPCPACGGAGAESDSLSQCPSCGGTGQVVREQRSGFSVFRQISTCDKCGGRGKIIKERCKQCDGKGVIEKKQEITVKIPAGADTGYSIRIEGEGERGEGLPGDLYVVLNVQKHPIFERHGDDIYLQQEIDFATAALGGEIKVPALEGEQKLDVPEGTQTGAALRIENKGIQHLERRGKGDEYVVVKVVTPTNLSSKEKELLKEFEKLRRK
jgi:molecular chaperone DnaJ